MNVLLIGNPVDGLRFHGPFPDGEAAAEYAPAVADDGDSWWVAELAAPAPTDTRERLHALRTYAEALLGILGPEDLEVYGPDLREVTDTLNAALTDAEGE